MIANVTNTKGQEMTAMAFPDVWGIEGVKDFRDALSEVIEICISYTEAKDAAKATHLYLLSSFCRELTKDIEDYIKKGGEV